MVVLVQEIINADYAFIIHTTNPSSGDPSEIYAEVVKGLGETLVGAYLGRALSFISKKDKLDSPKKGPEDSEAVKLKPTFADAYLNLANVYKGI
ncbi:putative alpha-glucan, water dikinase [Helianthus annuus]|uniref:Alpha-glucan, water dikinase n=1 Tax=Helianthus annuus TaxID=4232 RepID=A0A9K3DG91_HELAN|nr:putative alpha-glucan, water dikinase [Helianthus annuus]KAJ0428822.1 putative alpha-glucan, water dikinase [Helianthus annuus]KAJ0447154.1 putative alpha-glucan, water dikinase [Helianthus annuus]KAJ0632062.1 putative alpha-glucan, water dikinase [Helianthus annuus]KAJ0812762.1 putative alpha-glucan, water dikinase [Helianthus annuus]